MGVESHKIIVICAKIEAELAGLTEEEQGEYLKELGFETSGLERLIQKAYSELGLISFLTCGEKEVRAWTIKKGSNAVEAAGEIHTDFMKKFIKYVTFFFLLFSYFVTTLLRSYRLLKRMQFGKVSICELQ